MTSMDTHMVEFDTVTATAHQWVGETASTPIVFSGNLITAGPMMPSVIPEDEIFFWTPEWQTGEMAAEDDIAAGRTRRFASADDLIRDLLRPE